MSKTSAALVLFSGGQDSATCLAWSLTRFERVETIGFDYGQRHQVELECRGQFIAALRDVFPDWSTRLGGDHLIALPSLAEISDTALTRETEIEITASGLPTTFVPGRNLLFFTYAAALGYRRGIHNLVGGMCETDYSGYPDCRQATMVAIQKTLTLGMDQPFEIHTPCMKIDKAATWSLARDLGGDPLVALVCEHSHTCYLGERAKRHEWGYGCGDCPACQLRERGWRVYSEHREAGP